MYLIINSYIYYISQYFNIILKLWIYYFTCSSGLGYTYWHDFKISSVQRSYCPFMITNVLFYRINLTNHHP